MRADKVAIIGGGLAGVEAAYQLAKRGIPVTLFEMRPLVATEIHETAFMGELVCSNSLGSEDITSASGLLKKELTQLDSFFLKTVRPFQVPAGQSFSIDRISAAQAIESAITNTEGITVVREEIQFLPDSFDWIIIATGPLTSPGFAQHITTLTQRRHLYFYDATSPIIHADSIDMDQLFPASRYDKGEPDFLNIPLTKDLYHTFVQQLLSAELTPLKEVDKNVFFDACLPVEEIARRGELSLAYGPLKPVGLTDPQTGRPPFAVVQLRQDDLHKKFFQLVGFQTRLKYPEQQRIFCSLPGLKHAKFERYGRMHRNTYINAPLIIDSFYRSKSNDGLFFAGQISGVEGYVESIASGLAVGIHLSQLIQRKELTPFPTETAIGSLANAISQGDWQHFRPTKFSFGLLPELGRGRESKKEKKLAKSNLALEKLTEWIKMNDTLRNI